MKNRADAVDCGKEGGKGVRFVSEEPWLLGLDGGCCMLLDALLGCCRLVSLVLEMSGFGEVLTLHGMCNM